MKKLTIVYLFENFSSASPILKHFFCLINKNEKFRDIKNTLIVLTVPVVEKIQFTTALKAFRNKSNVLLEMFT